ncbi:bactofilin family protein [Candidatus Methylacidiphilum infernorum]|uniref:Integral membrane protein CcmA involved in cell shape determination n=1 Tax=Methylacidiphilum infernorum (isolate V4) TaxID=481448 RepID=B3DW12_METI4|nr:polymer-forming cytoskeletal protein [Candidatus Methylacidiphilum infernorum]ACD83515.1 Integral membrane protein CcmA involved in cell shape determination [Methylacidiphilum infernorum V4]
MNLAHLEKEEAKRSAEESSKVTILDQSSEFQGSVGFSGELQLNGKLQGDIHSEDGVLLIGPNAVVKAEIKAKTIIIKGQVEGNLFAKERLELLNTSKVFGDIKTSSLLIEPGAIFVGRSESLLLDRIEKPNFSSFFKILPSVKTEPSQKKDLPSGQSSAQKSPSPSKATESKPASSPDKQLPGR